MADKLYHTKGIVLRTVKYGETSVIVTIFTELFGLQSYMVNGVRAATKKGSGKANMFQPAVILDMVVYHSELRQLQRIKEYKWAHIYQAIFSDIKKNVVALFMIELLGKCLKQPESNSDLFHFVEDSFLHLDSCSPYVAANFPLFFALHLPVFFGLRIDDNYSDAKNFLDLREGNFVAVRPMHPDYLEDKYAESSAQVLKAMQPYELDSLVMNQSFRRHLLFAYEKYYALHIQDFGSLKTLPVLRDIMA